MAILFSQADGSDQHYDTYEEFEQAFILLKRLNGEKVPQDLLDEVSAKNSDKETKPLQLKIGGNNFESAFRKAVRDVGEELDKLSRDRTPVSDECENPETDLNSVSDSTEFRDGDLVRVMKSFKDSFGDVAEIGWVTAVDTSGTGRVFGVGGVLIGDNLDKLRLVCRREDRKDIEL